MPGPFFCTNPMNIKKNKITSGIALLAVLFLALRWFGFIPQGSPESVSPVRVSPSAPSSASPSTPVPPQLSPEEIQKRSEAQVQYQSHVLQMFFLTAIVFYGKVVDTNGAPIHGASVLINPTQGISGGNPEIKKTSDENGLFSIWTYGLGLVVNVSKTGYYTLKESAGVYDYAFVGQPTNPHTDSRSPAIFVLRKMGETEPLIMRSLDAIAPKNGTPVLINLSESISNKDIRVESWVHDEDIPLNDPHPFDWRFKITVLDGGGLQPKEGGEFDFMAPEDGYQPSDEINMSASDPKWTSTQSREYFLKLANGDFARLSFVVGAGGYNTFEITSYLNPVTGHRNLEYDPSKQINKK